MPHDPVLVSETKEWLIKATQDLRSAEHALTALPPLLGDVAYHCQQATEKALKAFLEIADPWDAKNSIRTSVSNNSFKGTIQ